MIVVTGAGKVVLGGPNDPDSCDPTPLLRKRKSRKYLGLQDDMAVVSAGRALEMAGLGNDLGERVGLYVAVGHIPFLKSDIDPVLAASMTDESFSMQRFSEEGYTRAHPLLAFRCLPNMPAYHVSQTFGIQGPYLVTYPGPAQTYQAIELACEAIEEGHIDAALVGGVAAQRNFLVEHHHHRLQPPVAAHALRDAAAFFVVEKESQANRRAATWRCSIEALTLSYRPFDPVEPWPHPEERTTIDGARQTTDGELGAATLPARVTDFATSGKKRMEHHLQSRDGMVGHSVWQSHA